jgi:cytochrome c peroxidase
LLLSCLPIIGCVVEDGASDELTALSELESRRDLENALRDIVVVQDLQPLEPSPAAETLRSERQALVELGRALAFDKILSGGRDVSCMTCHLPSRGTGDDRRLSMGVGASGLADKRKDGSELPRNAPSLFNLGASSALFWDGRVAVHGGQITSPAGGALTAEMQQVFEFGAISVLPLFPLLSREEMRGFSGNELASKADSDVHGIWAAIMARLGAIPAYVSMFEAAYPGRSFASMNIAHLSNAIAAFLLAEFTFTDSPWDRFLRSNDKSKLSDAQLRGAAIFFSARCRLCHAGSNFSDDAFHNVALAQLGPGLGDGPSGRDDFGRARVAGASCTSLEPTTLQPVPVSCRYAFRTTPLRNVELTAPYGHAGQFDKLEEFISHYSESGTKLHAFASSSELSGTLKGTVLDTAWEILATRDPLLEGVVFDKKVVDDLSAFMKALTDPRARDLQAVVPRSVPSGIKVDQ